MVHPLSHVVSPGCVHRRLGRGSSATDMIRSNVVSRSTTVPPSPFFLLLCLSSCLSMFRFAGMLGGIVRDTVSVVPSNIRLDHMYTYSEIRKRRKDAQGQR